MIKMSNKDFRIWKIPLSSDECNFTLIKARSCLLIWFPRHYLSYYSIKSYVVGTQNNRLNEAIHLSTHIMWFKCQIRILEYKRKKIHRREIFPWPGSFTSIVQFWCNTKLNGCKLKFLSRVALYSIYSILSNSVKIEQALVNWEMGITTLFV